MSNIEHLFENAIVALENYHDYDWWINQESQKTTLPYVKASPREIFTLAIYAMTSYRMRVREDMMKEYGYWPVND